MSYCIGDTVLYGSDGVCRIDEISERKIGKDTLTYYILKPIYNENSTIYVPAHNKALLDKMTRILSEAEVYAAIDEAKAAAYEWQEDDALRKEFFRRTIDSGNICDIIRIIRLLYTRRETQLACGKNLRVSDERILKECERIIFDEIALVLDIKRTQAQAFLEEKLGLA